MVRYPLLGVMTVYIQSPNVYEVRLVHGLPPVYGQASTRTAMVDPRYAFRTMMMRYYKHQVCARHGVLRVDDPEL
jgi:hypothetical protein